MHAPAITGRRWLGGRWPGMPGSAARWLGARARRGDLLATTFASVDRETEAPVLSVAWCAAERTLRIEVDGSALDDEGRASARRAAAWAARRLHRDATITVDVVPFAGAR